MDTTKVKTVEKKMATLFQHSPWHHWTIRTSVFILLMTLTNSESINSTDLDENSTQNLSVLPLEIFIDNATQFESAATEYDETLSSGNTTEATARSGKTEQGEQITKLAVQNVNVKRQIAMQVKDSKDILKYATDYGVSDRVEISFKNYENKDSNNISPNAIQINSTSPCPYKILKIKPEICDKFADLNTSSDAKDTSEKNSDTDLDKSTFKDNGNQNKTIVNYEQNNTDFNSRSEGYANAVIQNRTVNLYTTMVDYGKNNSTVFNEKYRNLNKNESEFIIKYKEDRLKQNIEEVQRDNVKQVDKDINEVQKKIESTSIKISNKDNLKNANESKDEVINLGKNDTKKVKDIVSKNNSEVLKVNRVHLEDSSEDWNVDSEEHTSEIVKNKTHVKAGDVYVLLEDERDEYETSKAKNLDEYDRTTTKAPDPSESRGIFESIQKISEGVLESLVEMIIPKGVRDLLRRMQDQNTALETLRLRSREENGGLGFFGRSILKGLTDPLSQWMQGPQDKGSLDSDRGFLNGILSGLSETMGDAFKIKVTAIYPGTLWCGDGHVGKTESAEVGLFYMTDDCCRKHDSCRLYILAGQSNYGLTNTGLFTRSHCSCDSAFYRCLKRTNTLVSSQIGATFFSILGPQCFKREHPIVRCITRTRITGQKCEEYELDKSQPKIWQWFDNPTF